MNTLARIDIGHSACPHDCPSTCALDVELLGGDRIGRVHGAKANSYTAGVVCAKVARYADRVHHPDRLLKPLVRAGAKGEGGWKEASWEAALDLVAEKFIAAEEKYGSRDGVALFLRRHDGPGAARRHRAAAPCQEIFRLLRLDLHQSRLDRLDDGHRRAARARPARDGEVGLRGDLGHQCGGHAGQCHDPRDPGAQGTRREDRRHRHLRQCDHEAGRHGPDR